MLNHEFRDFWKDEVVSRWPEWAKRRTTVDNEDWGRALMRFPTNVAAKAIARYRQELDDLPKIPIVVKMCYDEMPKKEIDKPKQPGEYNVWYFNPKSGHAFPVIPANNEDYPPSELSRLAHAYLKEHKREDDYVVVEGTKQEVFKMRHEVNEQRFLERQKLIQPAPSTLPSLIPPKGGAGFFSDEEHAQLNREDGL